MKHSISFWLHRFWWIHSSRLLLQNYCRYIIIQLCTMKLGQHLLFYFKMKLLLLVNICHCGGFLSLLVFFCGFFFIICFDGFLFVCLGFGFWCFFWGVSGLVCFVLLLDFFWVFLFFGIFFFKKQTFECSSNLHVNSF